VDTGAASDLFELTALFELVDERDGVDGLAATVEAERGTIKARMALAVEVSRLENLADNRDRGWREHHGAENVLFRVGRLWWDWRGLDCLGHG
jgi:hypothetical protein